MYLKHSEMVVKQINGACRTGYVISKVLGTVKTRPRAPQARASRGLHSTENSGVFNRQ